MWLIAVQQPFQLDSISAATADAKLFLFFWNFYNLSGMLDRSRIWAVWAAPRRLLIWRAHPTQKDPSSVPRMMVWTKLPERSSQRIYSCWVVPIDVDEEATYRPYHLLRPPLLRSTASPVLQLDPCLGAQRILVHFTVRRPVLIWQVWRHSIKKNRRQKRRIITLYWTWPAVSAANSSKCFKVLPERWTGVFRSMWRPLPVWSIRP